MFTCRTHGWDSFTQMCPYCQSKHTTTSGDSGATITEHKEPLKPIVAYCNTDDDGRLGALFPSLKNRSVKVIVEGSES